MNHQIVNADCLEWMRDSANCNRFDTIFADPPDNIGLKYDGFSDRNKNYNQWLDNVMYWCMSRTNCLWLSFNSIHLITVAGIAKSLCRDFNVSLKPCVQHFTFGQQRKKDLSNCYRPLWRFTKKGCPLFPDAVKVQSWRQANNDKRAAAGGKVPSDVFEFPRVTGNSKQRRRWHETQLHEGLVERCLKLTTPVGGRVLDPFGGTGTTLRVCKRIGMECTLIEVSETYYKKLCEEHEDIFSETVESISGEMGLAGVPAGSQID